MAENVMRRAKKASPITRSAGESSAKAPRVKPVRITVDLDPASHKALKLFAVQAETDQSSVIRALLNCLHEDPALAEQVATQAS